LASVAGIAEKSVLTGDFGACSADFKAGESAIKRFPADVYAQSVRGKKARFCWLWGTIIAIEERAIQ